MQIHEGPGQNGKGDTESRRQRLITRNLAAVIAVLIVAIACLTVFQRM